MSDHCPIFCKFRLPVSIKESPTTKLNAKRYVPSWRNARDMEKVSPKNWQRLDHLKILPQSVYCQNVHCNDVNHKHYLDEVMANVLKAVVEVANEKLPMNSKKEGTEFKGKKDVDPVKYTAHFWHAIWKSAGKPINCHLHTIMKKTRNRYHLIIRKKRRLLERMKRDNILQSCLENDGNIFDDIKRQEMQANLSYNYRRTYREYTRISGR